jgi:hypothetical protein
VYTAGKAGIRPGGGIRVGMRHLLNWTWPQTEDPKARGYFTARASRNVPVRVFIPESGRQFFGQYFAWQNMVQVTLPEEGLPKVPHVEDLFARPEELPGEEAISSPVWVN